MFHSGRFSGVQYFLNPPLCYRDANSQEEPKPLLHPEVDLASSVLQTLREATDEEYQDALARDAARTAARASETDPDTDKIVTIIIDPNNSNNNENDATAEASHVQESHCIHPFGSSCHGQVGDDKPLFREVFAEPSLLHKQLFDMDSGASNIQERIAESMNKGLHGLKLKTNPQALKNLSNGAKSAENLKNIFKSHRLLETDKSNNLDLTSAKIPMLRHNPVRNKLNNPLIHLRPLDLGINKFINRARESEDDSSDDSDNNLESTIITQEKIADDTHSNRLRLGFKPLLPANSLKLPKSTPLSLENLLNLKDVELIPPKANKFKLNIPQLKLPNLGGGSANTRKILRLRNTPYFKNKEPNVVNDGEVEATELVTNIEAIPRQTLVETEILDVMPNPSENHHITDLDGDNFESSTIPINEQFVSNNCNSDFLQKNASTALTDTPPEEENIISINEGENMENEEFEADEMYPPIEGTDFNDVEVETEEFVENEVNDRDMDTDTSNIDIDTDNGSFFTNNNNENTINKGHEVGVTENSLLREDCLGNLVDNQDSLSETSNDDFQFMSQERDNFEDVKLLSDDQFNTEFQQENEEVTLRSSNRALPTLRQNILLKLRTLSKPNTKVLTFTRYRKPDIVSERANKESQDPDLVLEPSHFSLAKEESTETLRAVQIDNESQDIDESVTSQENIEDFQPFSGQEKVRKPLGCKANSNFTFDAKTKTNSSFWDLSTEATEATKITDSKILPLSHTEFSDPIKSPLSHTEILDSVTKPFSSIDALPNNDDIIGNENSGELDDNNIAENEDSTSPGNLDSSDIATATTQEETRPNEEEEEAYEPNIAILDSTTITSSDAIPQSDEIFSNSYIDELDVNNVPENEDNTCPVNLDSSSTTTPITRDEITPDISIDNNVGINEMSAEASESFVNIAQQSMSSQPRASLFDNLIVQPPSLFDNNLFNRPLNLNAPLPTLDDLTRSLTGILGTNQERDDLPFDESTELDSPNISDRAMATDSSTTSSKSLFPPLKPLKDINLDIFQIKPLTQTGLFIPKIPSLNLNTYKAKLAVPQNLKLKPIKLQSTLGNNDGLLGAALTLGPTKTQLGRTKPIFKSSSLFNNKGSDLMGSALTNIPTIDELTDQIRANAESLLSFPLTTPRKNLVGNGIRSGPSIGDLPDNIRSHTENTMRSLQQTLSSTLKQASAKNAEKLAKPNLDLAEMVTSARDDMNDKLKAIHLDLNDKLTSLHKSIADQTKLPKFRSLGMSNIKLPSIIANQKGTTLGRAKPRLISPTSVSHKRPTSQVKKPSSQNTMRMSTTRPKYADQRTFRPFKISKAASSLTSKTVEVPKLTTTSAKPPFSRPLYRDASVKLKEAKPLTSATEPLFGGHKRPLKKQFKPFGEFKVSFSSTPRPAVSSIRKSIHTSGPLKTTPKPASTKPFVFGQRLKSTSDSKGFASEVKPSQIPFSAEQPLNTEENVQDTSRTHIVSNPRTTQTKLGVLKFGDTIESSLFKPIIPSLKSPQLALPKIPENSFLTKIREALKSRQVNNTSSQVQSLGLIKSPDLDTARSASENKEIVLSQEPLKENVSYKCKMVCVREPRK